MRVLCVATIVLLLFLGISSCNQAQDQTETKPVEAPKEKVKKAVEKKQIRIEAAESKDAILTLVAGSDTTLGIELTNSVPISGVQFTLEGADMSEIRTTDRSKDFLADFNKDGGKVVILSVSGNKIAPGSGLVAEVVCSKIASASLKEIKLVK